MTSRKRSEVWLHFTPVNEIQAKCDLCKGLYSYKGGATTNLKRHLESRHPTVLQKVVVRTNREANFDSNTVELSQPIASTSSSVPTMSTQNAIVAVPENSEPMPGPSCSTHRATSTLQQGKLTQYITRPSSITRQKRLNNELLKFIIKDFQPFSVVEDQGFKNFTKALDPTYELPSRSMLTKSLLPQHFEKCRDNVAQFINQAASVAITTDTWTSINTDSYMAITGHIITEEWTMGSVLLECTDVSSSRHTGDFLKDTLVNCFQKYGIQKKISAIVTDNAANISAAVKLTNLPHVRCFAHSLNLIVQDGVKEISVIQKKVKLIVEHFHRSTASTDKLKQLQIQMNGTTTPLKLINDVVTRWNSTFHMFERYCLLQEPVQAAIALLHAEHLVMLTQSEISALKEICLILKPFDGLTTELSAENSVTISKIIVIMEGIKHYLNNLRGTLVCDSARSLLDVIQKKISERFQNADKNYVLQLSTYLDPRFKNKMFSESTTKVVKERVVKLISDLIQKERGTVDVHEEQVVEEETPNSIWSFFEAQNPRRDESSPTAMATIELRQYIEEALICRKDDPLKWWRSRSIVYPHLASIAKRLLAIPASSVSSERIFSKIGLILSERRNRIKPKNLNKIVFLNANFKFCDAS